LVLAEHRGMRSLGIAMAIGSLACMFVACVVLPTVLEAIAHAKSRAKSRAKSKATPGVKPHSPSGSA
jgi:predicted RND superfamily exporter protein